MKTQNYDYVVPAGYGYSSPTDFRRLISDLISRAIDQSLYPQTSVFREVYNSASNLTGGCCFYCNKKLYEREKGRRKLVQGTYAWDHFIPASRWGLLIEGNVVLACVSCNLEKSAIPAREYWEYRRQSGKELRFKTEKEFDAVEQHLIELEKVCNIADFYPTPSDDGSLEDILQAFSLVGGSELATEYLGTMTAGNVPKWTRAKRPDADILEAISDIENDEAGLWAAAEAEWRTSWGHFSRVDVKARISNFTTAMDDVIGRNDLREVTPKEFRAVMKYILDSKKDSTNELQKYQRLFRVLLMHPDLRHLNSEAQGVTD